MGSISLPRGCPGAVCLLAPNPTAVGQPSMALGGPGTGPEEGHSSPVHQLAVSDIRP